MNGIDERLRGGLGANHPLPSPDLDIAMSRLLRRAQRRRWARRAGAATVLVAVAAVVVGIVLTGPWHPRGQGDPDQHEILTPPGARPRILEAGVGRFVHPAPLAPGTYGVRFLDAAADTPVAVVDLPAGFAQDDDVTVATGPGTQPDTVRLEFWTVAAVPPNACGSQARPVGPTAGDLARALGRQRPRPRAQPVPTRLAGHPAYQLTLAPRGPGCSGTLWQSFGWPKLQQRGWTDRLWILDVEGQALVVDAAWGPRATRAEIDQLLSIVEGMTLSPPR